jgi:histidinol-phosphate aminotransferase
MIAIRPLVRLFYAYVPGEQPMIKGLIKLSANENPPAHRGFMAVKQPSMADCVCIESDRGIARKTAQLHRCRPDHLIVGNGSDELLALATRAFVEPAAADLSSVVPIRSGRRMDVRRRTRRLPTIQYFTPSYSLYPVLADIHGAAKNAVPLRRDFSLPDTGELKRGRRWNFHAALTFVTTPNAPGGRATRAILTRSAAPNAEWWCSTKPMWIGGRER